MSHRAQASIDGEGPPTTVTPEFIGQSYYDKTNENTYISYGVSEGNWYKIQPTTTKGDLIIGDGTDVERLGVGANDQSLVADSTENLGVKWSDIASNASVSPVLWSHTIASGEDTGTVVIPDSVFDAEEELELVIKLKNGPTSTAVYYAYINGDSQSDAANYENLLKYIQVGSDTTTPQNNGYIGICEASKEGVLNIKMYTSNTVYHWSSRFGRYLSSTGKEIIYLVNGRRETGAASSITGIALYSTESDGFGEGTKFELRRPGRASAVIPQGTTVSMEDDFESYANTTELSAVWTLQNQTNAWGLINDADYSYLGGQKSLGIDQSGDGTPDYVNTASVSHARRSSGIESGDKSFCCEAIFQSGGYTDFNDYLKASVLPTSTSSSAGTDIDSGWQVGEVKYAQIDDFIRVVFDLNPLSHNSTDLTSSGADVAFSWINNASDASQPPAVIKRVKCWTSKLVRDNTRKATWGACSHYCLENELNPTNYEDLQIGDTAYCPEPYAEEDRWFVWDGDVWINNSFIKLRLGNSTAVSKGDTLELSTTVNNAAVIATGPGMTDVGPCFFGASTEGNVITAWSKKDAIVLVKSDVDIDRGDIISSDNNGYIQTSGAPLDGSFAVGIEKAVASTWDMYRNVLMKTAVMDNGVKGTITLVDDASFSLPSGTKGFGTFMAGNSEEIMRIRWSTDAVVTIDNGSTNTASTDSDGDFCAFDGGSSVTIKNRTGSTKEIFFHYRCI